MIVTILLGVVTLAVLVFAFLATKVWHWAHVLVLVAFYFACVGYAVLAARSLDKRLEYQKQIAKAETDFEQQTAMNDGLQRGTTESAIKNRLAGRDVLAAEADGPMRGTVELEHQLRMTSRMRGRVWRFAEKLSVDQQTGFVSVGFPVKPSSDPAEGDDEFAEAPAEPAGPPPLGMEPDAIVYAFEQGPLQGFNEQSGPRLYIGEFRVDSVEGRKATLEPLDQLELDDDATERLLSSDGPWIVYESMPADDRDLFADMDEETLRRLLPASSVEEYLRDRTLSTPADPPERLEAIDADGYPVPPDDTEGKAVATRYRRQMRDYTLLLNDLEAQRAELVARTQAITADIDKLQAALKGAEAIRDYREAEIAKWRTDLVAVERDRRAIEQHVSALESQLGNARRLLDSTLEENAKLASFRLESRGVLVPFGSGALDVDAL